MNTINDDTIIAPATIPGTGAISLLRISGPKSFPIADSLVSFRKGSAAQAAPNTIKFGTIYKKNAVEHTPDTVLDEVLVCIYKAPHSYTGEDSVEIMCHASSYIVSEIIAYALEAGARFALPGEFTQRSFLSGKMDMTQAEAVADVVASSTEASHRVAVKQLKGGFSSELASLREKLLEMASLLELELDFSEEDVEFAKRDQLDALLDTVLAKIDALASSFRLGNAIKNGIPVAIVGPTNAGKSTLLNCILGEQRAIVSNIAGTTRDTIEETFNVDGVLFRFVDTAGIRETSGEIEKIGIQRSFESIRKAEIVIILLDAVTLCGTLSDALCNTLSKSDIDKIYSPILDSVDFTTQKVIFVLNKADLIADFSGNKKVKCYNSFVLWLKEKQLGICEGDSSSEICQISALTGNGVDSLLKTLSGHAKSRLTAASDGSVLVTNIRHWEALVTAHKSLQKVKAGLASGTPTDLVAEDLRSALSTLGTITGEITHTEVLENIFKNFCIGK